MCVRAHVSTVVSARGSDWGLYEGDIFENDCTHPLQQRRHTVYVTNVYTADASADTRLERRRGQLLFPREMAGSLNQRRRAAAPRRVECPESARSLFGMTAGAWG